MTDEQMDARLRQAGESWRAATTSVRESAAPVSEELEVGTPARLRRPRAGLFVSAAAVVAALVAGGTFLLHGGGGHTSNADAAGLKGTVWRLVGVGDGPRLPNSDATFYIGKDDRYVADDTCQVTGGRAEVEGGQLLLTPSDTRDKQCTDSVGELTFSGRASDTLLSPPNYAVDGANLTISHAGDPALHLVAAPELPAPTTDIPSVEDAKWQLVKVTDVHGHGHALTGALTMQIKNGELVASDGCNALGAEAAYDGRRIDLKGGSQTLVGCNGERSATAAAIDAVYRSPTLDAAIDGVALKIRGDAGELVYRWVPDDAAATDPANLTGKTWHLISIAGDPAAGQASLRLDGDQLTGSDGCGALRGTAQVSPGAMTLTGIPNAPAATCAKAAADQASTLDSFLQQRPALWSIRSGKLLIYGGGAQAFSLVFSTDAPPAPPSTSSTDELTGHPWTLTSIETTSEGSASGSGSSTSLITLTIAHGRYRLASASRCAIFAASEHIAGNHITFTAARNSGPNLCVDEFAEQAGEFLAGTATWSIDGGQLTLTKGDTTLTFDS